MKPEKHIAMVELWSCGNPAHHHKTEDVAKRCIEANRKSENPLTGKPWTNKEKIRISMMRETGKTNKEIAANYGVHPLVISSMSTQGRKLRQEANWREARKKSRLRTDIYNRDMEFLRRNVVLTMRYLDGIANG